MTPYAILQVRSADADEVIRKRFHDLARKCHPDTILTRHGANCVKLAEDWKRYSDAYALIKTPALRAEWERRQAALSGRCQACRGGGVQGGALSAVKLCSECRGEGRKVR
jgi:DnaJ-class molecular chaperone